MKSVEPQVGFPEVTLAVHQAQYDPLTVARIVYADGTVGLLSRWKLTEEEREKIARGDDLYLTVYTFGKPMQPVHLEIGRPQWAP